MDWFCPGAPPITALEFSFERGIAVDRIQAALDQSFALPENTPLFSLEMDKREISSLQAVSIVRQDDEIRFLLPGGLNGKLTVEPPFLPYWKARLILENTSDQQVAISNLVPLGREDGTIYITAAGPPTVPLARANLFRPGKKPVSVILPDDAWDLGYAAIETTRISLCALARKKATEKAEVRRYQVTLEPGGTVEYRLFIDGYDGPWQNGLRRMFREYWLFDLERFDNRLFERADLSWIRRSFLILLQFAWDHSFYDSQEKIFKTDQVLEEGKRWMGGYDVFGLWASWPRLGLDQRNQWDLYADLPGGLGQLRTLVDRMHKTGTRFFLAYNPWDKDTRPEDPAQALSRMIQQTDADGVVLDTMAASSGELQESCDAVKPGVVLYSEGMAVVQDMPSLPAGRVHDALFLSPLLNLNKLIKPDFALFRVCRLGDAPLHREIAVAFFNGYGVELNAFAPGRPLGMEEDFRFLGKAIHILRDNAACFTGSDWTPLVTTRADGLWVNEWPGGGKKIYTLYSALSEGFDGPLLAAEALESRHYVDLWNHQEITLTRREGKALVPASLAPFAEAWRHTRREGSIGCIAQLPRRLMTHLTFSEGFLTVESPGGRLLEIWKGTPSYESQPVVYPSGNHAFRLAELLQHYRGTLVLRLMRNGELEDERILEVPMGLPVRLHEMQKTEPATSLPDEMVEISAGEYTFQTEKPESLIAYPDHSGPQKINMNRFYMDRFPVTNARFYTFLEASGYRPGEERNFLKHWLMGMPRKGEENHPVVNVDLEDARAYARWAGKRLPTEMEWQYAAQGMDGRRWPWGKDLKEGTHNPASGRTTVVDGYPQGASPFGVLDLVGNVWQLTDDEYDNGSHRFVMIRGGSFYHPKSSEWYLPGGAQPLPRTQMLLRVAPEYDRSATVGFRCVKDAR